MFIWITKSSAVGERIKLSNYVNNVTMQFFKGLCKLFIDFNLQINCLDSLICMSYILTHFFRILDYTKIEQKFHADGNRHLQNRHLNDKIPNKRGKRKKKKYTY
jgi:hypothetical protein